MVAAHKVHFAVLNVNLLILIQIVIIVSLLAINANLKTINVLLVIMDPILKIKAVYHVKLLVIIVQETLVLVLHALMDII